MLPSWGHGHGDILPRWPRSGSAGPWSLNGVLLGKLTKQKLLIIPDLEGQVGSEQVQDLIQGSGSPSKCKGQVCCCGPLADLAKTWMASYPHGDMTEDIAPNPWPDCTGKRARAPGEQPEQLKFVIDIPAYFSIYNFIIHEKTTLEQNLKTSWATRGNSANLK